jgi:hypothetical protein
MCVCVLNCCIYEIYIMYINFVYTGWLAVARLIQM